MRCVSCSRIQRFLVKEVVYIYIYIFYVVFGGVLPKNLLEQHRLKHEMIGTDSGSGMSQNRGAQHISDSARRIYFQSFMFFKREFNS